MFEHVVHDIVYGVDWALVFYVILALFVLEITVKRFGLSPIHAVFRLFSEVLEIFKGGSRVAVDGGLTLAMILFTMITVIFFSMHEFIEQLEILKKGVEAVGQPWWLVVMMIFWTGLVGILSLVVTRKDI